MSTIDLVFLVAALGTIYFFRTGLLGQLIELALRREPGPPGRALTAYASQHGYRIGDGTTIEIADTAQLVQHVTGEPPRRTFHLLAQPVDASMNMIDHVLYRASDLIMDT
jgi:hypothetical protein